jgi:hypothetical protein
MILTPARQAVRGGISQAGFATLRNPSILGIRRVFSTPDRGSAPARASAVGAQAAAKLRSQIPADVLPGYNRSHQMRAKFRRIRHARTDGFIHRFRRFPQIKIDAIFAHADPASG